MTAFDDRSWARYDDPAWRTAAGLPGLDRAGRASQPLDPPAAAQAAGPYRPPSRPAAPHQAPDHPASDALAPTRACDRGASTGATATLALETSTPATMLARAMPKVSHEGRPVVAS
jgi:hypothetical protein